MNEYKVTITETLKKTVTVEAENREEAEVYQTRRIRFYRYVHCADTGVVWRCYDFQLQLLLHHDQCQIS